MKEIFKRSLSGLLYILLLIFSLYNEHSVIILFFVFGLICLGEFKKLIQLKSTIPYLIYIILYSTFAYWEIVLNTNSGLNEIVQILMVLTIFVDLFLIKDLFSGKIIPLFSTKRFLLTTFYISSSFVFLVISFSKFSLYFKS